MSSDRCDHRDCVCSCGVAIPVLHDGDSVSTADVLRAVEDHLRTVLVLLRVRPAVAQMVGFEDYHAHVSRLVLDGGAAFAKDIVSGVPLPVASERHAPDDAALLAAADFILLVTPALLAVQVIADYVNAGITASTAETLLSDEDAVEADDADVGSPVPLQRETDGLRPKHEAMPGRGWPVTSLAPPVAA